ncbi:MAG: tripartite tricarboxylate transporter substrate binding protein [Syntrophales bacterium LBB04]|nr:tripartite tricarboxylate transporter substrate binding protein [Syntrophales bacterium LBB04]
MRAKRIILAAVSLILGAVLTTSVSAANYPSKPVEIVIPFAVGSDSDVTSRLIADVGSKHFGQPIVPVNKPGGGGSIAVADVISAKPDGYKLLFEAHNYFATTVKTHKVPFDPNDLVPVANLHEIKLCMAVRGDSPFKTFEDLREYGKKHPGELKWSHSGRGTPPHLTAMLVFRQAGLKMVDVPYKGSSEQLTALLGGHVDVATGSVSTMLEQMRAGKVRLLMVYSNRRFDDLPNVPTVGEVGFPDAAFPSYWGIYVRKDVPEPVKKVLADLCKKIAEDPDYRKGIERLGGGQVRYAGPEFVREATKKLEVIGIPILKELGLYVER